MESNEEKQGLMEGLVERAEAYAKANLELMKLKSVDKAAGAVSSAVSRLTAFLLLFMFLIMAGVGASLWLGELLGKTYYGFLCVAGVYALAGILLYVFKNNWIRRAVSDAIITQALN
jgi:hypothetical protein